jgi:hypothetical protein
MMVDDKVKGPASYFPSIEKKYGRPIDHWLTLVAELMQSLRVLPSRHAFLHKVPRNACADAKPGPGGQARRAGPPAWS